MFWIGLKIFLENSGNEISPEGKRMSLTVVDRQTTAGQRWEVVDALGNSVGPGYFETHAEAWRWIERREGEPISPGEKRSEYGWNQFCNGR